MTGHILQILNKHERELGPFGHGDLGHNDLDHDASPWRHWHLRNDTGGIAWLLLDHADSSANVLSQSVLEELNLVLDHLISTQPKGLVLRSAKANHFCVGADIKEFGQLTDSNEAASRLRAAHAVADRLAKLSIPSVAVIHGHCLGGGLELALCCNYRIGVPGTTLGFPEVMLGLHPGLGGTARSTFLIDPVEAMTMMLTGKNVHDRKAKKLGLIDALTPERHIAAAVNAALTGGLPRQKPGLKARLLNTGIARQQAARKMLEKAAELAPADHYPAPGALVHLWEKHGDDSAAMREAEIVSFAELLSTDTARNLIRVFFLREAMKGLASPKAADQDAANPQLAQPEITPPEFNHVHVIGAGAMGGDIAGWCALEGKTVTLFDTQAASIATAIKKLAELCDRKHLGEADKREVLDRLIPDLDNLGLARADVVIEAVPEKIDIKRQVYQQVEPLLKAGAILATNTSSIPLEKLTQGLQDPGRLVGLHFFNPVAKMTLIEVVSHGQIAADTFAKALAFTGQISRLPAPVSSAPGFLVNRALTPYLLEAILLLNEGVAPEAIDKAAEDFGMPVGPIELADLVGLDICLSVADMLRERLLDDQAEIPAWVRKKVNDGEVGKKAGKGLYPWKDGKAQKADSPTPAPKDTVNRLILPMLNACMACLREGVIKDEALLDGAMIFGTGFAPFRGGPMHYARTRGFATIVEDLQQLEQQHGARFKPDAGWTDGLRSPADTPEDHTKGPEPD